MSAEVLREAANLMRRRAQASLTDIPKDPRWVAAPTIDPDNHGWVVAFDLPEADWDTTVTQLPYDYEGETARHIASWHPVVALAVADWLEGVATELERRRIKHISRAMAVAYAYLGTQPTPDP